MTRAAPARSTGRTGAATSSLSIGEVLATLRPEFPDISISKIRYLESEGLVEPERAPSGYRRFSHADVARLHYVLAAQRDHYWPLRVIKDALDAIDRGLAPPAPLERPGVPTAVAVLGEDGMPDPASFRRDGEGLRLTRVELVESAGVDPELLASLEAYGLLGSVGNDFFDADALAVARTAGELTRYGLEPRHLRAIKTAAEREVGLVEQVVATMARSRTPDARGRTEEAVRDLSALMVRLHVALVRASLPRVR